MKKKLRYLTLFIFLFCCASLISVYSYGIFAKQAKGIPSYTLAIHPQQTVIDHLLDTEEKKHPNQSALILLQDNLEAFAARALSAQAAGRSLDLQYYIWHDDLTGRLLMKELLDAAGRGVRIRLLLDDLTTHNRSSILAALNTHPYISVRVFNPTRARNKSWHRGLEMILRFFSVNRRMHNKAWIVDGRIAIVGGRNIGDEYFDASPHMNFFDIDLMVLGSAVRETSEIFDSYWNSDAVIPLEALGEPKKNALDPAQRIIHSLEFKDKALPYLQQIHATASLGKMLRKYTPLIWTSDVHVYADPPEKAFGSGETKWLIHTLTQYWDKATKNLKIISPYFVPTYSGMQWFNTFANRHLKIDIITNSLAATDVLAVHGGYANYRKPLLLLGVNLFEVKPSFPQPKMIIASSGASLHTKAFIMDETTAFIGSFNFDPRSSMLNTEMGIMFKNSIIIKLLLEEFELRSSRAYSYRLKLENGNNLLWEDEQNGKPFIWKQEPQSKWWQRIYTMIISWLPIETQL